MDIFKSKPLKLASAAFYIVLMFLSFYCACYRLPVGLKYAINLLSARCSTGLSSACASLRFSFFPI